MTTAILLAACVATYLAATGAIERFNTIAIRAVSTGLFVVALAALAIGLALEIATF